MNRGSDSEGDIDAVERSIESMGSRRILLTASFAIISVAMVVVCALFVTTTLRAQSSPGLDDVLGSATESHRFSFVKYELTHLPNRWLTNVAGWLNRPDLDEQETLQRWFEQGNEADRKRAELLLEQRLSQAASEMALDTPLPLFGRVRLVWPPVDVDLSERLHVVAVSPRDEVQMVRSVLLTSEVERDDYDRIEAELEADGRWSAWVGRIGGVALYPASVVSSRDYLSTLQIMAHEWTHHYLGFYPLGLAYGRGSDMRTINETVADIVGDELADSAAAITGFEPPAIDEADLRRSQIRATTDPLLRQLRIDVDSLLSDDRIEEAERLMEDVRLRLSDLDRPFRRINQAFLAFRGGYGASPSSASPWGPRLIEFRRDHDSLADFLKAVRGIGSPDQADALLPR